MHETHSPTGGDEIAAGTADRRRALREALTIGVVTFVAAVIGVLGLWVAASSTIRADYGHYLTSIARTAAQQIDPDLHRSLRDPAQRNGPEYLRAVEPLRRMQAVLPDVRYLYTMTTDEAGLVRFVLDAALPGDRNGDGVDDQANLGEVYIARDPAMLVALGNAQTPGRSMATDRPYADKWGNFMTGWAPLLDAEGEQYGILGIDIDASLFLTHMDRAHFWALVGLLPAALLIVALGVGFYRIRLRGMTAARDVARAARVLGVEQERLHSVVEGTNVGIWEMRIDPPGGTGGTITVDARLAAMLGRRAEDLNPVQRELFETALIHPEDAARCSAALQESLQAGRMFEMDMRLLHVSGRWIWTEVRGKVIERNAQGQAVRMVGTQMDVSVRKTIEQALVDSERKFRSLFEMSPVGICLVDAHSGRFLKVNDALVASTGYTRDELLDLSYHDITPDYWREFERQQLRLLDDYDHFGTYEKEYQRKDGSRYPVLISGTRIAHPDGGEVLWAIVQDISERKAMESQLADAALRDRLTGLANKTQFMEHLQQAVERVREGRQQRFAVLFLDFDRFKLVNDAMGHEAGDGLLREIAARLRTSLQRGASGSHGPDENLIARFGGDEFLVLLNCLEQPDEAMRIAEELLAALARPYQIDGRDVYSTASIGVATSDQGMESADALVRSADMAMYEAKRSGRACAVMFDEVMRARLTRFVTLDSSLRQALGTSQLSLVYQPIVDLTTNRMTSAEALVRWNDVQLGVVTPSEFIPVAEESGLIVTLGHWVMREACQALAIWRSEDPAHAPQTVSVNISRAELALGDRLLARVRDALAESGLPAECLRLEVTERDVMRDPSATLKLMQALGELGVHLAMDDFGTGTSSLGCLRDYPFDVIKIDRSFISDVSVNRDVLAMIHAALTLVQNLGKTSVAEGVETAQQVAILQSLGCHYAQGHFFSRPLLQHQMLEYMASDAVSAASRIRRTSTSLR